MLKWDLWAKLTVFMIILAGASIGLYFLLELSLFDLLCQIFIVAAVICFLVKIGRALFKKEIAEKTGKGNDNN